MVGGWRVELGGEGISFSVLEIQGMKWGGWEVAAVF